MSARSCDRCGTPLWFVGALCDAPPCANARRAAWESREATVGVATLVRQFGSASVYRCTPPLSGYEHVVVSVCMVDIPSGEPRTIVHGTTESGDVAGWVALRSRNGGLGDAEMLRAEGYEVRS